MTIDEMKMMQARTEMAITDALRKFMDDTGCKVEDLSYNVHEVIGGPPRYYPVVILRVVL